jgi:hypothetical protein
VNINDYIDKAKQVTDARPMTGFPSVDRTEQTNLGLSMARRWAEQSQTQIPAPAPMKPIVPLAN